MIDDLNSRWDEIKESIRIEYEIPDISYKTWIDPLKIGDIKDDTVYILGDICHHMAVEEANRWITRMNGKKVLLIGNHDKQYDPALFVEIRDFMTVSLNGIYFALMHYPMLSWPKKNSGSIHIHGHIHSDESYNLKNREDGILRYDAGVDANQFLPVSVQQVIRFFEKERIS